MTSSHPSPWGESSKSSDDGGPAFPCEVSVNAIDNGHQIGNSFYAQYGMTLRDYFAAHAPNPHDAMPLAEHSAYRYRYADAMIKARSS